MTEYEIACLGKARFFNRRAAKHRASQIRRQGGPHFRTYQCTRYCGLWHLGHRPGEATYVRTTPRGVIPIQELTQ